MGGGFQYLTGSLSFVLQEPHNEVVYTLTGDSTAMEFFMVDYYQGYISLKQSLALDPQQRTQYTVSHSPQRRD